MQWSRILRTWADAAKAKGFAPIEKSTIEEVAQEWERLNAYADATGADGTTIDTAFALLLGRIEEEHMKKMKDSAPAI